MDAGLKNTLTGIEKGFNIAGCIPVVAFFSGAIRATAGKVQLLAGAVMAGAGGIGYLATKQQKWKNIMKLGAEFVLHGALNVIRGFGEAFLAGATIVGNLFLLIPNLAKKDKFSPFIPYGTFTNQRAHRPQTA